MDLTGSIAEITAPLSLEGALSVAEILPADAAGSSAIQGLAQVIFGLPNYLLNLVGVTGADLGSSGTIR